MSDYRYQLEPYNRNSKHRCPSCDHKTFTLYIDTHNSEYVNSDVGRCDREIHCGYHIPPREYFNNYQPKPKSKIRFPKEEDNLPKVEQGAYIRFKDFNNSLKNYDRNSFISYLVKLFNVKITSELILKYFIGTRNKSTIFWQIDFFGNIRTGKIMAYDPINGRRIRYVNWVHQDFQNFDLKQCLFGEHLLRNNRKRVAVVESEKTAIIASAYLPEYIWLASGGKNGISEEKFKVLKDRNVTFIPDIDCFEEWIDKIFSFQKDFDFKFWNELVEIATDSEIEQGLDLADYLIRLDSKKYTLKEVVKGLHNLEHGLQLCFLLLLLLF